jgi:hypothetical protein
MVDTHFYGNLAGLLISVAVLLGVLLLAWGRPDAARTANRSQLRVMWFVIGLIALTAVIFRAVILIAG